jgi:hypothetical protein
LLSLAESLSRIFFIGRVPRVVEIKKGVFSRYPKKETGSWRESDRGGTRLWGRVHNVGVQWKVFSERIG